MNQSSGVVLLLISGVVTILVLLSLAILQTTRFFSARAAAQAGAAQAQLAAASGMEYAASRLASLAYPSYRLPAPARRDDWRFLDAPSTPPADWRNPSFPHGEPWADTVSLDADSLDNDADGVVDQSGEGTGILSAGEPWADRDGDGRPSPWSGRVRGGDGALGVLFTLRVESIEAKIPVNAGDLSPGNSGNVGEPFRYHRSLEHVLNNLGAILGLSTRVESIPAGDYAGGNPGQPIILSRLGADLIRNRPAGGWRDAAHWRSFLAAPPLSYTPADLDRIEACVDVGPYETPAEYRRDGSDGAYAPVCLATAPRDVLRALWTYVAVSWVNLPGPAADWERPCSWTGDPAKASTLPFNKNYGFGDTPVVRCIDPDEAGRLADLAIAQRLAGSYAWSRDDALRPGLFQAISWSAATLFPRDWGDLDADANPATTSLAQRVQAQMKADLAFFSVSMDGCPYYQVGTVSQACSYCPSAAYLGWGFDRDPSTPQIEPSWIPSWGSLQRVCYPRNYPDFPADPADPWPWNTPSSGVSPYRGGEPVAPQGLTMAPPVLFRVASHARAGAGKGILSAEAVLRTGDRIEAASQEDFEGLSGFPRLIKRGIRMKDSPSPAARRDGASGFPKIWSVPRWNRRSAPPSSYGPLPGYSRTHGALCLAGVQEGLTAVGAKVHLPFSEDFDGNASNDCPSTSVAPLACQPWLIGMDSNIDCFSPFGPAAAFYYNASGGECVPGLDGNPAWGNKIQEFSVECWMNQQSKWGVMGIGPGPLYGIIGLTCSRRFAPPDRQITTFFLNIGSWISPDMTAITGSCTWEIEDREHLLTGESPRFSFGNHVVLTMKLLGTGTAGDPWRSRFRLFVNGHDHPVSGPMTYDLPFAMQMSQMEYLLFNDYMTPSAGGTGLDEVRLYDRQLQLQDALDLYRLNRHVKRGVYTSPLYALDAPARVELAQWTGIAPARLDVSPFDVRIQGYADPDGSVPLGSPLPLGARSGDLQRLSGDLPIVRSFRYYVTLDCNGAAGVLNDSPFFESLWLILQRRGSSPAWTAWSSR